MDPYTFTHLLTPISPTSPMGMAVGLNNLNNLNNNIMHSNMTHITNNNIANNSNTNNMIMSDYFVPKLEIIDTFPRNKSSFDPPEVRRSNHNNNHKNNHNNHNNNHYNNHTNHNNNHNNHNNHNNLSNHNNNNNNANNQNNQNNTNSFNNNINYNFNNNINKKPIRPHIIPPESPSSSSSTSSSPRLLFTPTALSPPSPSEEDPNSPTFFIDSYSKIRSLSGEIFQCAGDTIARGYATDNAKIEFYAHELLKVARQLNNNSIIDDDDKKRPTPPLVRPRRIRRKHIDDEELDDEKKRKIGAVSTTEMYCHSCGTTDTPEWRRGPDNCKSLCNACGLHYAKMLRRETMIPNRAPARQTMTLNNLLN